MKIPIAKLSFLPTITSEIINQAQETLHGTSPGDPIICECCDVVFSRPSGWFFHKLCKACFDEFDTQKMLGRFGGLKDKDGNRIGGEESSTKWAQQEKDRRRNI